MRRWKAGDICLIAPPAVITAEQIDCAVQQLREAIEEAGNGLKVPAQTEPIWSHSGGRDPPTAGRTPAATNYSAIVLFSTLNS